MISRLRFATLQRMRLGELTHLLSDPNDGRYGDWAQEQLVEMDARFVAALEQAFELGLERRESASNQVRLPASLGPRWSTPLCQYARDGLLRSATADGTVFVARG